MPSALKTFKKTTVATVDGKKVETMIEKIDRFKVELWVADVYDEIEATTQCYICLTQPAR